MKEQIEEIAVIIEKNTFKNCEEVPLNIREIVDNLCIANVPSCGSCKAARALIKEGYRKQSEGEWEFEFTLDGDDFYKCSVCGRQEVINGLCKERNPVEHYPYCHCGAKMKAVRNDYQR